MSFHTSEGHRRSTRSAGLPPPDPLDSDSDDNVTTLFEEQPNQSNPNNADDATTVAPSLAPTTAQSTAKSRQSTDISHSVRSRDPPSANNSQRRHENLASPKFRQTQRSDESIPDSITTTQSILRGAVPNNYQAHLETRLDDLSQRVLELTSLQAKVESIDTTQASMMQGITEILKTIQPVQVQVVPTLSSIQEQPTQTPPVSNLSTPVQQPPTIPPTHSPNMLTSPTTTTPPCVTPANPYPMVPPVPPYSASTHQSNTPQQSINLQPPPQTIVNQSTIPFFFNQQPQQPAPSPTGNSTNTNGQQTVYIQQSNTQVKLDEFKPSRGDNY